MVWCCLITPDQETWILTTKSLLLIIQFKADLSTMQSKTLKRWFFRADRNWSQRQGDSSFFLNNPSHNEPHFEHLTCTKINLLPHILSLLERIFVVSIWPIFYPCCYMLTSVATYIWVWLLLLCQDIHTKCCDHVCRYKSARAVKIGCYVVSWVPLSCCVS